MPAASTPLQARALRRALAAHFVLAASMGLWRAVQATPALSIDRDGWFAGTVGEVLVAASVLIGVGALGVAAFATVRARSHPGVLVLGALLALSLAQRQTFDVFDLSYLLAVPVVWVLCRPQNTGSGHAADARA